VVLSGFDGVLGGSIWHDLAQMDIEEKRFKL